MHYSLDGTFGGKKTVKIRGFTICTYMTEVKCNFLKEIAKKGDLHWYHSLVILLPLPRDQRQKEVIKRSQQEVVKRPIEGLVIFWRGYYDHTCINNQVLNSPF